MKTLRQSHMRKIPNDNGNEIEHSRGKKRTYANKDWRRELLNWVTLFVFMQFAALLSAILELSLQTKAHFRQLNGFWKLELSVHTTHTILHNPVWNSDFGLKQTNEIRWFYRFSLFHFTLTNVHGA